MRQLVVPMPLAEGKTAAEALEALRNNLQGTLDARASEGWRFVGQIESVTYENPGCLAAIFGAKATPITRAFLVFERQ